MGRTINLEPASCGVGHHDSSLASAPPEGLLVDSAALTKSLRSTLIDIDVVDRGRPTGLVLVSAEAIRLLHWQAGWVEQPERSLYELEPGQWRDYDAYVGHPGRTPDGMHVGTFDQRVDEWRDRFLTEPATAIGQRGASSAGIGCYCPVTSRSSTASPLDARAGYRHRQR